MVHEQDPSKGACPFRRFFEQTPEVLQKKHRLFDVLAVPLYPSPQHRQISLSYALRDIGATPRRRLLRTSRLLRSSSDSMRSSSMRSSSMRRSKKRVGTSGSSGGSVSSPRRTGASILDLWVSGNST